MARRIRLTIQAASDRLKNHQAERRTVSGKHSSGMKGSAKNGGYVKGGGSSGR